MKINTQALEEMGLKPEAAENMRKFFEEEEGAEMLRIFKKHGVSVCIQIMNEETMSVMLEFPVEAMLKRFDKVSCDYRKCLEEIYERSLNGEKVIHARGITNN